MTIDIEKWAEKIHENCMYGASVLDIQDILQAYAAKVHDKRVEELEAKNRELSASINDLLYTTPQRQQPLKRLTDEQINKCFEKVMFDEEAEPTRERIANAIMDAMQELNK